MLIFSKMYKSHCTKIVYTVPSVIGNVVPPSHDHELGVAGLGEAGAAEVPGHTIPIEKAESVSLRVIAEGFVFSI